MSDIVGDAAALFARGEETDALALLGSAARSGSLDAMADLGARLSTGTGVTRAVEDGIALLDFAATRGHALAARDRAVLAAIGATGKPDFAAAEAWLSRAAEAGDEESHDDLVLLRDDQRRHAMPDLEWLSADPRIGVLSSLAPPTLCTRLIERAQGRLERAGVSDRASGEFAVDAARTNESVQLKLFDLSLPLIKLQERLSTIVGQPVSHFEAMNILSYRPGERFDIHYDYFDEDSPGFAAELAERGQRVATALIYLNADYEGGETDFPRLTLSFKGEAGDALIFFNTADGRSDPRTLHAGLPPRSGRKWVLSQWVRDKPQP